MKETITRNRMKSFNSRLRKESFNMKPEIKELGTKININRFGNMKHKVVRMFTLIFMINMAFVFLFPFIYMVVTSFKSGKDLYDYTVNWIPRSFEFNNYLIAFKILEYPQYFKNSFVMTAGATIGHLISCSFIGYGFARYEFKGKKLFFSLAIVSIIIPVQTIIIPQYMIFANLKWIDTYLPMVVPAFLGYGLKGGLYIFIFRQFYLGLPIALEDAARIDGCGFLRTYWQIVLPIAKSSLLVSLVLSVVWHWNDYYEPLIYVGSPEKATLPSRISKIISLVNNPPEEILDGVVVMVENVINNAVLMAGTFLVVLPVLIIFAFLQRQFMQGIERTGLVE